MKDDTINKKWLKTIMVMSLGICLLILEYNKTVKIEKNINYLEKENQLILLKYKKKLNVQHHINSIVKDIEIITNATVNINKKKITITSQNLYNDSLKICEILKNTALSVVLFEINTMTQQIIIQFS